MPRARIFPARITTIYEDQVSQSVRERYMGKINRQSLHLITNINNAMKDTIGNVLRQGIEEGSSVAALGSKLLATGIDKGVFKSARRRAYLIARTELHRARQQAARDVYEANNIKLLKWIAISDGRICNLCLSKEGRIYRIETLKDYPPLHPRCFLTGQAPIYTLDGWKSLIDIKVDDFVLTHKGRFRKVTKTIRSVSEKPPEIITILAESPIKKSKNFNGTRKLSITSDHPVLVNGAWILAKEVKIGDHIRFLAGSCKSCGIPVPFFRDYCSSTCHSSGINKGKIKPPVSKATRKKLSDTMVKLYEEGKRDRYADTLGLVKNCRKLLKEGTHPFQNPEIQVLAASGRAKHNYGRSFAEVKLGWFLKRILRRQISLVPQYPIQIERKDTLGRKRYYFIDWAIPELKIAIEVDGVNFHKNLERDEVRQKCIESLGWQFIRFSDLEVNKSLSECACKVLRLVSNHSNEIKFIDMVVQKVAKRKAIQNRRLYNLAVEEDESYVAKGFVVHNCRCRVLPSDFDVSITVKRSKNRKVVETKISPSPTDYLYVVKLKKALELFEKSNYEYSSTQVNLPKDLTEKVLALAKKVNKEDLHPTEKQDDAPHVTVLYGLHTDSPKPVKDLLESVGSIKASISVMDVFQPEERDYDVLVHRIDSPELHQLNLLLRKLPFSSDFSFYSPHITICYLKRGTGQKYINSASGLEGLPIEFNNIVFSSKDGKKTSIDLKKAKPYSRTRKGKAERVRGYTSRTRKPSYLGKEFKKPKFFSEDEWGRIEPWSRQRLDRAYKSDADVWEGYTIGQHTAMVLKQFDKYFSTKRGGLFPFQELVSTKRQKEPITSDLVPLLGEKVFRKVLLLHDVGKAEAIEKLGDKKYQSEYNKKVVAAILPEFGVDKIKQLRIAASIVGQDWIGDYLKGDTRDGGFRHGFPKGSERVRLVEGLETLKGNPAKITAIKMYEEARKLDVPIWDYYKLCKLYWICDASSYTKDAGGLESLDYLFDFDSNYGILAVDRKAFRELEQYIGVQEIRQKKEKGEFVDVFHGTSYLYLEPILKEGISSGHYRNFEDDMYTKERKNSVFASETFSDAAYFSRVAADKTHEVPVILQLKIPNKWFAEHAKEDDRWSGNAIMFPNEKIPPEWVAKVFGFKEPEEWKAVDRPGNKEFKDLTREERDKLLNEAIAMDYKIVWEKIRKAKESGYTVVYMPISLQLWKKNYEPEFFEPVEKGHKLEVIQSRYYDLENGLIKVEKAVPVKGFLRTRKGKQERVRPFQRKKLKEEIKDLVREDRESLEGVSKETYDRWATGFRSEKERQKYLKQKKGDPEQEAALRRLFAKSLLEKFLGRPNTPEVREEIKNEILKAIQVKGFLRTRKGKREWVKPHHRQADEIMGKIPEVPPIDPEKVNEPEPKEKIPEVEGVEYVGVQKVPKEDRAQMGGGDFYLFNETKSGSTFATKDLSKESIVEGRDRTRKKFERGSKTEGNYLYHVTTTKKFGKITKQGILPLQTTNWVQQGNKTRYGEGEIYSFEHIQDALRWAAKMDWDFNAKLGSGNISIVKFRDGGDWQEDTASPLEQSGKAGKWLKRMKRVPAENIVSSVAFTQDHVKFLRSGSIAEDKDIFTGGEIKGEVEERKKFEKSRFVLDLKKSRTQLVEFRKSRVIGKLIPHKIGKKTYWAKALEDGLVIKEPKLAKVGSEVLVKSGIGEVTAVGSDGVTARDNSGRKIQILNKDVQVWLRR